MAVDAKMIYCWLLLTYLTVSCTCEESGGKPRDGCFSVCKNSYPEHTYPKPDDLLSCKSGCRFYKLSQYHENDGRIIYESCKKDCDKRYEAYNGSSACYAGCDAQKLIENDRKDESSGNKTQKLFVHLLAPLARVRYTDYFIDAVHNVAKTIRTTLMYFLSSDGSVVALKSQAQYVFKFKVNNGNSNEAEDNSATVKSVVDDDDVQSQMDTYSDVPSAHASDWLTCISTKSGLPRWFVAFSLIMLIISVIWLGLSTITTSQDKLRPSDVSIFPAKRF
ncbi:Uncharacterised protein r2_g2948 [Pycnogonum litorale]